GFCRTRLRSGNSVRPEPVETPSFPSARRRRRGLRRARPERVGVGHHL
ncbi:MAG: hypothetical protein AVDCRST_MAG39-1920, partial [uncultured Sphingomonadaceae bacterium]